MIEGLLVILLLVGAFFAGRNYERKHPQTEAERKAAEDLKNLFKRK